MDTLFDSGRDFTASSQASALWYDNAKATLAVLGLYPTTSDGCLYTNKPHDQFVLLHVDDFQVMGPNRDKINKLMFALHKKYKLKPVNTDLFLMSGFS
ncbi:hypothetical protein K3495_g2929 [Podosphaera aphanis]|nr:hypothetical protein K3495_g2929 [Podosphaera aphanis]